MPQTPNRIVLLGPQGSGKGTQAAIIARRLKIPHISSGEILRTHIKNHTPLGRRLARRITAGKLAPDRVMNRIFAVRLAQPDCRRGFILDGYPRTLAQARYLERSYPPNIVLALMLPDREAIRRIGGRRMAPDGTIYHLKYDPPPRQLLKLLVIRHDDLPRVVGRRLRLYRLHTIPLLHFYHERGVLQRIDAKPPIPAVTRKLLTTLTTWRRRTARGVV